MAPAEEPAMAPAENPRWQPRRSRPQSKSLRWRRLSSCGRSPDRSLARHRGCQWRRAGPDESGRGSSRCTRGAVTVATNEAEAPAADPAASPASGRGAEAAAAVAEAEAAPSPKKPQRRLVRGPPSEGLRPDTRVAAAASNPDLPYLGVWATDAATCTSVDQAGTTGYVVITAISVRQDGDLVLANAAPLTDGKVTLGDFVIAMPTPDTLTVGGGAPLVRCAP